MTREEIIRMAREAGFSEWAVQTPKDLERFAALVAAAEREKFKVHAAALVRDARHDATEREREACAMVCDEHWRNSGNAMECADAIRARGEK